MKAFIQLNDILTVSAKLYNIVPTKPQTAVLSCVKIQALDNQLILTTSDLTITLVVSIPARVEEEGELLLPAKQFFPLLKELVSQELSLSSSSYAVTLSSGASEFKLAGANPEGFPLLPNVLETTQTSCSTLLLKEMLGKTLFCAGKDDNRPMFSSIHLQKDEETTTFTGTDGRKLARTAAQLPFSHGWSGSFILPLKTAAEICNLLDAKEELSYLSFLEDKVFIQTGPFLLVSRLISGEYPEVARIIPEKTTPPLHLHKEELSSLLRQISLFTTIEHPAARFTFSSGKLELSIANMEAGEGKVEMPLNFQGEPVQIGFNPVFFLEILRHIKDETLSLHITDSYSPGLITDSSSAFFVLMPMRT